MNQKSYYFINIVSVIMNKLKILGKDFHLISSIILIFILAPNIALTLDYKRGMENYNAILAGGKNFDSLSQDEKKEVISIVNIMKRSSSSYSESDSEECREAKDNASSYADDLANYTKKLKNCAESKSFSDDCYWEFRRTKNSHSDYESAVSEVQSECEDY